MEISTESWSIGDPVRLVTSKVSSSGRSGPFHGDCETSLMGVVDSVCRTIAARLEAGDRVPAWAGEARRAPRRPVRRAVNRRDIGRSAIVVTGGGRLVVDQ